MRTSLNRATPALALLALFAAIAGGTAVGLQGRNTVDSGDIRNGQVKPPDLEEATVRTITANPEEAIDPCAGGAFSIFCGTSSAFWGNLDGYEPAGYYRDGFGTVHLKGTVFAGAPPAHNNIFLLPNAYQPRKDLVFAVAADPDQTGGGELTSQLRVEADGDVFQASGDVLQGISLDGVSFLSR